MSELGAGPHRPWGRGLGHELGVAPTDTALLPSGVDFTGTTVGLAKVSAMCSQSSGAVNQVRGSAQVCWTEAVAGPGVRGGHEAWGLTQSM